MCDLTASFQPSEGDPNHSNTSSEARSDEPNKSKDKFRSYSVISQTNFASNRASNRRRASEVAQALPPTASARRSRFQTSVADSSQKATLTPSMRKKHLQNLFLNYNTHSGLTSILSLKRQASRDCDDAPEERNTFWALDPMEHAWTLSAVNGNFNTIVGFLSEDPSLLTRKDFISGFTVLHWLAKNGKHEILVKLLRLAEKEGYPTNVNMKGSGGLTPLHLAVMHSQYMVIKILVGAFGANVELMDYNGKRAWQYLKDDAPSAMKELLGAWDEEHSPWQLNVNNNCAGSTEATPTEEIQKDLDVVDSFKRNDRSWFGSFRKRLTPFFSGGKK
ncbi:ankyrin repeat domain-containing protein SOWAHB [Trichomycterus rosablanca]|uniref:ankyrin repeat domain-containing protein SOWAHB n=1 Tax=Trichomycterus rosablanca TaxID=2290929 RepID=UPI002F35709A